MLYPCINFSIFTYNLRVLKDIIEPFNVKISSKTRDKFAQSRLEDKILNRAADVEKDL